MATTTSLIVGNLHSVSTYVDSFIVEVYSNPGLTTLVGSGSCGSLSDGSGGNSQAGPIVIAGLTYGGTYYTRAGVVAPYSGLTTWSSTVTVVVGTHTAPSGVTYTVTLTATISGVTVAATPSSIPADLAYYEAIWTTDGSTPASTAAATWQGSADGTATINFFIGSQIGQIVTIFIRAVNTGGQRQAWTSLGTASASLPSSSANLVLAGPKSGGSGAMTLRALVPANIPNIAEAQVTNLVTDLAAKVPATRTIATTAPLTGGGDLSANRTLAISAFTGDAGSGGAAGAVPAPPAGSAAAGKFLKADGMFAVPSGGSSVTTKGDVQGFSTVAASIPVGSDGQVLTADSTQALGLKWASGGGGGGVAPALVQSASASGGGIAFPSANTLGNTIVVWYAYGTGSGGPPTLSDSRGNSYPLYGSQNFLGGSTSGFFIATNIAAGANTVSISTLGSGGVYMIFEYSGVTGIETSVATSLTPANQTSLSVGPITTTSANTLVLMGGLSTSTPVGNSNGWSAVVAALTSVGITGVMYSNAVGAAGSYSNALTFPTSSTNATQAPLVGLKGSTSGGAGTVTSVAVTVPSRQTVTGSPVTTAGTLAITDNTQSPNIVFAGPASGAAAAPTFRTLVSADLPSVLSNPMTTKGDIIYGDTSGAPARLAPGTSGNVLQTNGAGSAPSWVTPSGDGGSSFPLTFVQEGNASSNGNVTSFTIPSRTRQHQAAIRPLCWWPAMGVKRSPFPQDGRLISINHRPVIRGLFFFTRRPPVTPARPSHGRAARELRFSFSK